MYMNGMLLLWTPDMRDSLWGMVQAQLHNPRKNRSKDPDNPTTMNAIQFGNIYGPFFEWFYEQLMLQENKDVFNSMRRDLVPGIDEHIYNPSHPNDYHDFRRIVFKVHQHWNPRCDPHLRATDDHFIVFCSHCYWPIHFSHLHWTQKHKNMDPPKFPCIRVAGAEVELKFLLPACASDKQYVRAPIAPVFENWEDMMNNPSSTIPILNDTKLAKTYRRNGTIAACKEGLLRNVGKNPEYQKVFPNPAQRNAECHRMKKKTYHSVQCYITPSSNRIEQGTSRPSPCSTPIASGETSARQNRTF